MEEQLSMNMGQEAIKILIQNCGSLIVGLAIAWLGYWLNKKLEKFKADQLESFQKLTNEQESNFEKLKGKIEIKQELATLRIMKIAECWEKQYEYENKFFNLNEKLKKLRDDGKPKEVIKQSLTKERNTLVKCHKNAKKVATQHRFWLGERLHNEVQSYLKLFPKFCDYFDDKEYDKADSVRKEDMTPIKQNIEKVLKDLGIYFN